MKFREFLRELHRRNVWKVAVAYTAAAVVLLEVLTHLFHNFEAPHWVLKVITTLLVAGLPLACLAAWGFEVKEGRVRSVPREPQETKPVLPAPTTAAPPSIAVLPFEDMSPEQDQKYLGHGIAEELLNALASIAELKVAARTSSFALAGRGTSMQEIGDTLHVRHVLEGSVRRSGQKLRITAQLIDVQSGFHLFSEAYDRSVEDIFDIQNEIAREIVTALLPKLGLAGDVRLVRHGTTNLEAYNLRLKAREGLAVPDPLTADQSFSQLRQAIALDPTYADAWGDLAYLQLATTTWDVDPVPAMLESYRSAMVALDHDPDNVQALLVLAYLSTLVHRDHATAGRYLARARQHGTDLSYWAFIKAITHDGPLGRYDDALAALEDAWAKDPLAPSLLSARVWMLMAAGRMAEAVGAADAALPLASRAPTLLIVAARTHVAAGNVARARELLESASRTSAERYPGYLPLRIAAEVGAGNRDSALKLLDRLLERGVDGQPSACFAIGEAYLTLGDVDHTFEWWTRSVERREPWSMWFMAAQYRNRPVIGKDPRFLVLLRRMGLESCDVTPTFRSRVDLE
jgi:TolB-like protein/Tfp pilus assembly protein PilF